MVPQSDALLLALGRVLGSSLRSDEILFRLTEQLVLGMTPADSGIIYLYDRNRHRLSNEASYGYPNNIKYSIIPREGAAGMCYAERRAMLFSSAKALKEQAATLRQTSVDCLDKMRSGLPPVISIMVSPLLFNDKVYGVIQLEHHNSQHRVFTQADLSKLKSLSNWISLIIDDVQSHLVLKQNKRSYRHLLSKVLASGEEERKKVAREIHDEVNQLLLSARLKLEELERTFPDNVGAIREKLQSVKLHINQVFDALQRISLSLRPPVLDELGLPEALDWYIQNLTNEAGLPITLYVKGLRNRRPAPVIEMELFRISQEALSNVIKHARATSARVELRFNKLQLVLRIEDNGEGFNPRAYLGTADAIKSLGLLGMQERAEICGGSFEIDSAPESGTRITVKIPISSYDWGVY